MGFDDHVAVTGAHPAAIVGEVRVNGASHSIELQEIELHAELETARERAEVARRRTRARESAMRQAMRDEVEATRRAIAEVESRHREALALIAAAAELEIEQLRSTIHRACVDQVQEERR